MAHRKERTAKLHAAYNTMTKADAVKFAVKELGYTAAGASSWFSYWDKTEAKPAPTKQEVVEAVKTAETKSTRDADIAAAIDAAIVDDKREARNKKRREARAAKKKAQSLVTA